MCEGEHDRTQAPRHVLRDDGTAAVRAQGVVVLIPGVLLPFLVLIGADRELPGGIELRDRDIRGDVLPREHPARSVRRARPGSISHRLLHGHLRLRISPGRMTLNVRELIEDHLCWRSEEHTSELQSHHDLVCRLLLEKKKKKKKKKK